MHGKGSSFRSRSPSHRRSSESLRLMTSRDYLAPFASEGASRIPPDLSRLRRTAQKVYIAISRRWLRRVPKGARRELAAIKPRFERFLLFSARMKLRLKKKNLVKTIHVTKGVGIIMGRYCRLNGCTAFKLRAIAPLKLFSTKCASPILLVRFFFLDRTRGMET